MADPTYITIDEAARRQGTTRGAVIDDINQGTIPSAIHPDTGETVIPAEVAGGLNALGTAAGAATLGYYGYLGAQAVRYGRMAKKL